MEELTRDKLERLDISIRSQLALKEVGLSLYFHVYELKGVIYRRYCNPESVAFLNKIVDFYNGLTDFEKLMFICDFLEIGRHSKYWYEQYRNEKSYYRSRKRLYVKVCKCFYEN